MRRLARKWGLRLLAFGLGVLVLGYIVGGPAAAQPSAACRPGWHPRVYCTPGYIGPIWLRKHPHARLVVWQRGARS